MKKISIQWKYSILLLVLILLIAVVTSLLVIGPLDKPEETLGSSLFRYPNANIILIVIDTLRADHLGCYGYSRNTSPEIDNLARKGIVFNNMFAQTSWTKPGTASILSGLFPKNHGANTTDDRLSEEIRILPEILEENGYSTYGFVANWNVAEETGFNQGYKEFFVFEQRIDRPDRSIHARSDEINRSLADFFDQLENSSRNFIYIHYMDPHYPYLPKEKHFSKANTIKFSQDFSLKSAKALMSDEELSTTSDEMINAYDDEILYNDRMIGDLVQMLKKKNMYSSSIIIITSDHGEEFFEHGNYEHGKSLYNEQLNVPLIIRLPNEIHKKIDKIANQIDIMPTVLSVLNLPISKDIDGISLFDNKRKSPPVSYAELDHRGVRLSSVSSLDDKLIEGISLPYIENGTFSWFEEIAILETEDNSLDLLIRSFNKKRTIQISADGKPIDTFEIDTKKQALKISLPKSRKRKIVTIESLTPCQIPKELGINKDERCLAFSIFNSRNVNIEDLVSDLYMEYYSVADDHEERNNLYNIRTFTKNITRLRKSMLDYLSNRRNLALNNTPAVYDEKQLHILKALGYIR